MRQLLQVFCLRDVSQRARLLLYLWLVFVLVLLCLWVVFVLELLLLALAQAPGRLLPVCGWMI